MKNPFNLLICFLLSVCLLPSVCFAVDTRNQAYSGDTLPQCNELVKGCFAHAGLDRANCFYSAATHPFCESSSLGKLVNKRWEMAPNRPTGTENAKGLLGPQLVNKECLRRFDNQLSAKLLEDFLPENVIEGLEEQLESCLETLPIDLVRP